MAEWIVCPNCNLRHSARANRLCPRCKMSVDGTTAPEAPPEPEWPAGSPFPAASAPADPALAGAAQAAHELPQPSAPGRRGAACHNHPEVASGLVRCARCGRAFCSDCVVALRGQHYCAECKTERVRDLQSGAVGLKLGVMEALRLGWQLVTRDLWPVWLVGFVFLLVQQAAGLPGYIPYVGILWTIANVFFIQPPLQVGFVYAMGRTVDGAPADVADIFEGYKQRYIASIVVMLPMYGLLILLAAFLGGGAFIFLSLTGPLKTGASAPQGAMAVGVVLLIVGVLLFAAVATLLSAVAWFACVALWDTHESGWDAFGTAARLVWSNARSAALFAVMMSLIFMAAAIAGVLGLCVGLFFTIPFAWTWLGATLVYLYRSWSQAAQPA